MKNFDNWFKEFKDNIVDYSYYTDFDKIHRSVDKIKIELNILNSLVGSSKIEDDFENVLKKYPETLKCIPILLAIRREEISILEDKDVLTFDFKHQNNSIEQYKHFMRKTGLFDLLENHIINNLIDYVTGVETGLDSNARKNRGGKQMEKLVESYIQGAGYELNKTYFKEMYLTKIEKKWDVDLTGNEIRANKKFDFVLKVEDKIYAIETNFYSSSGSKLNETARSYKNIALEVQKYENFEFVWITDGPGWKSAKGNLRETYEIMKHIYNINDLENGVLSKF